MGNFDVTTPVGSDLLSQGDDKIREFKLAMREALRAGEVAGDDIEGVEAIFPGASPSTAPVYRYRGLKDTTANRPSSGQYGLYFDTTRNVLQRDNGSTWDDVATVIPSGTKMVFYQASAPTGWTAVAVNDKFIRVVTAGGTGGSAGGSGLTPSSTITLAHSHSGLTHSHTVASHSHNLDYTVVTDQFRSGPGSTTYVISSNSDNQNIFTPGDAGSPGSYRRMKSGTVATGVVTTSDSTPSSSSELTNTTFAYADVIVASKD